MRHHIHHRMYKQSKFKVVPAFKILTVLLSVSLLDLGYAAMLPHANLPFTHPGHSSTQALSNPVVFIHAARDLLGEADEERCRWIRSVAPGLRPSMRHDLRNVERVNTGIELIRNEYRALAQVMESPAIRNVAECLIALNPRKVLMVGDALWPLTHLFRAMGVKVVYVDSDPAPVRFKLEGMAVLEILNTNVDKLHLSPWNTYASLSGNTFDLALLLSLVGSGFAGNLTQALLNVGRLLTDGGRLYVSNEPIHIGQSRTTIDQITALFPGSKVDTSLPQIVTRYDLVDRNVLEYPDAANVCIQLRKSA